MRRAALAGSLLLAALTACSSSSSGGSSAGPDATAPSPASDLNRLLLQPQDVPGLTLGRPSTASVEATTNPPQLALCTTPKPVVAHRVASVIAKPAQSGKAQVFELVSVFPDAASASAALAVAQQAVRACGHYASGGTRFTVADLSTRPLPGTDATLQYRLVASDVIAGDVRTLVQSGRYLVLLSGFGAPPAGQTALGFQAAIAAKAVSHLS